MLLSPDERVPLARLMTFMEHAERLAHDCASAQATLAPEAGMRRFLRAQAAQEASHALAFHWASNWLAPRHLGVGPALAPLERYRALLERAIRQRNFGETLLAEQVILEGLGEAALKRIEAGLVKRGAGFARLRRTLLHQEEAHRMFGLRALGRLIADRPGSLQALRKVSQEYLGLADDMLITQSDVLHSIHEDPGAYQKDARNTLPAWLLSPLASSP